MGKIFTIDGIKGNFFGGLPYNATWSFNDGNQPSTLSVSVVSAESKYPSTADLDGQLTYLTHQSVSLGNFAFNGYLVDYSLDGSPEQKTLTLQYEDLSSDLDRYYVGLHKKYGDRSGGNAKGLIILGKEYLPCDKNLDSTKGYDILNKIDPCDPCPNMPSDKYKNGCDPVLESYQIYEVYYTFNELIAAMPIGVTGGKNLNKLFKAQHVGSLRSVLSAWCSDLGLSWYFDPFDSQVHLVDRSKAIKIPSQSSLAGNPKVMNLKYGGTKKGTFSRGFIGYLGKAGEIKKYQCKLDPTQSFRGLSCLTLGDLLNTHDAEAGAPSGTGVVKYLFAKEMSSALAYYSKSMRDAFLWYGWYGIKTRNDAKAYIYNPDTARLAGNGEGNKIQTEFGNRIILKVYAFDDADTKGGWSYLSSQGLSPTIRKQFEAEDLKNPSRANNGTLTNPSYYFFIAISDEEVAAQQFQNQQTFSKDFLGKFWTSSFSTPVPGASNEKTQMNISGPDGSGEWYPAGNIMKGLPIFNFGHQSGSKIGDLFSKLDALEQQNQDPFNSQAGGNSATKTRAAQSFAMITRDAKWSPDSDTANKDYASLFSWYDEMLPQVLSKGGDDSLSLLRHLDPDIANKYPTAKVYVAREIPDFTYSLDTANHPLEPSQPAEKTKTEEDSNGNPIVTNLGPWGLQSNKCVGINFNRTFIFYPPVQAFSDWSAFGYTGAPSQQQVGYTAFLEANSEFPKVIPKVEIVSQEPAASTDVSQLDYHYKVIQEKNMALLTGGDKCIPTIQDVNTYIEQISTNSAYTMADVRHKASFKVPGVVPLSYKVSDGLSSLQLTVTDNGVYTDYSFEDKIIQPPSDEYIQQFLIDKALGLESVAANRSTSTDIAAIKSSLGVT